MAEEVKLLKTWSSPFGLRIVWALKLKGLEYETMDEDLSNKSALLLHSNPVYKRIPVLIHNGNPISESLVILEYIDQAWTQNPILPQHPLEKARQRFWAKFNDDMVRLFLLLYNILYTLQFNKSIFCSQLIPSMWSVFSGEGKGGEEALLENLRLVEEELKGKRFFGGDKIGLADLAFGWLANLMGVFEEVTGLKIMERFPLLSSWIQEFSDIPIIKDNCPSHDKLVVKYQALYDKFHAK
ncbi:hypothetical protein V6N13_067714 [Hibiscus sabdariffa]|uniref:glutathione transferase n=1 Tax=Hibiscus sabdariffa TaxID=183260 RepID=A0ABR2DUN2_9ROSI